MTILLLGDQIRDHGLAEALAKSLDPLEDRLIVAPGNAGTLAVAENFKVPDTGSLLTLCRRHQVDLAVVASPPCLAAGWADELRKEGLRVFGPGRSGARLGASRSWAKEFVARQDIKTDSYRVFESRSEAAQYLRESWDPVGFVIQSDDLGFGAAPGTEALSLKEGLDELDRLFKPTVQAGRPGRVLVSQRLEGLKLSAAAMVSDGVYRIMPIAQVYRAVFDGERGSLTEGMGAVTPVTWMDGRALVDEIDELFFRLVSGLEREGIEYRGALQADLVLASGGLHLVALDATFGDLEAPVMVSGVARFLELVEAVAEGRLQGVPALHDGLFRVCIAATAAADLGASDVDEVIDGLEEAVATEGATVFHGGTSLDFKRGFVARRNRALAVMGASRDLLEAQERAYRALARISFESGGPHYRPDIGADLLVKVV